MIYWFTKFIRLICNNWNIDAFSWRNFHQCFFFNWIGFEHTTLIWYLFFFYTQHPVSPLASTTSQYNEKGIIWLIASENMSANLSDAFYSTRKELHPICKDFLLSLLLIFSSLKLESESCEKPLLFNLHSFRNVLSMLSISIT